MTFDEVLNIISDVPNYKAFLTVAELRESSYRLAEKHPAVVEILPVGESRRGESIEAIKIGAGAKQALLFALPHPNEPIGSMMLEYLSLRLAEDDFLRRSLGYTWYLIKCIDPDGTRLNEGWFKGPFSIENYARHHYRPPSFQQVEWTFPVDYETLHFHNPLPETQAIMVLIERVKPDFIFSLHNSSFGGAYFYITEDSASLYEPFYKLVESQDLPLHLGEPEVPYIPKYADAIFKMTGIREEYDYLSQQTNSGPAEFIKGGTDSFDYALRFCNPFGLVCELPYYYNPAIHNTSPSDMVRGDAILRGVAQDRGDFNLLQERYNRIKDTLTVTSPFRDSVEEILRTYEHWLSAEENWVRKELEATKIATIAEKFDSMVVRRFYRLFPLGMFIRLLEAQMLETGETALLTSVCEAAELEFKKRVIKLEADLDYTIIPIQKLVRVQLGSALLAATYATGR
jgi:hypothetical protein